MKNSRYTIATLAAIALLTSTTMAVIASTDDRKVYEDLPAISVDDALAIARSTISTGQIVEIELENDDGQMNWEVEAINDTGQEIEIVIDAQNGQIVSRELDD
ncbi:MAG: PepSY domain-containing protein [Granulosicoccus sp.]